MKCDERPLDIKLRAEMAQPKADGAGQPKTWKPANPSFADPSLTTMVLEARKTDRNLIVRVVPRQSSPRPGFGPSIVVSQ